MTQFQPPPLPVSAPHDPPYFVARPWSAAAIAGFVLSLLGCLGVTAILGFILGLVGVLRTRGGRQRGFALAVAAMPISLLTGVVSVFLLVSVVAAWQAVSTVTRVLAAEGVQSDEAIDSFREFCSIGFQQDVSEEDLQAWLKEIRASHGKFVEIVGTTTFTQEAVQDEVPINLRAKYVNGTINLTVKLAKESLWRMRIDDIEINGSSPRQPQ